MSSSPAKKLKNSGQKPARRPSRRQRSGGPDARIRKPGKRTKNAQSTQSTPHQLRKRPRQERSREMVSAILEAAAELFASQGYARATTNKIAERAGVSVGSLYQYFPNKDSLLASLLAQHHAEVHAVVDVAMTRLADPGEPLEDCLRQLLHDLVGVHRANPTLTQALSPAILRESTAREDIHKIENDAARARQVVTLLATRPDVRPGNHAAMALVLGQTLSSLTPWMVHDAPAEADVDLLTEEILQLVLRYLKS